MRNGSRLHRLWFNYGELGYVSPERKPRWWPTRINEWFGNLTNFPPMWVWRPLCWVEGHVDNSYGNCVVCWKPLP